MARERAGSDLDIANDFNPALECRGEEWVAERKARTRNDRVHALHERRFERSEGKANAGIVGAERSQGRRRRSRVGNTQPSTMPREPANARKPRVTQPENQDVLAVPFIAHLAQWVEERLI